LADSASDAKPVVVPITPFRLVDTRAASDDPLLGGSNEPFAPQEARTYQVAGVQTVPADAVGVVLNITSPSATTSAFLTVWPFGQARPVASTLNPFPGRITFNSATTLLGSGRFSVFNSEGSTHVIVDVVGYLQDHNHDEQYLEQTAPIVELVSLGNFSTLGTTGPTTVGVFGPTLLSTGGGIISLPFDGPASVGGTSYDLVRVDYCVQLANGAFINSFGIATDELASGVPATIEVTDQTDRTTTGCYGIDVPANGGQSFGALIAFAGAAAINNSVYLFNVRATWNPV